MRKTRGRNAQTPLKTRGNMPAIDYSLIGEKIKEARINAGFTQEKLSEEVDVSPAFIGHIERGERSLSLNTLLRITYTLNISMDYLFSSYTTAADEQVVIDFKQLINNRPAETKEAVLDIVRTSLKHLD